MSNAEQLIWTRSQSKLESHQRERTVTYLAVAGKNPVSFRLFFQAERVRLKALDGQVPGARGDLRGNGVPATRQGVLGGIRQPTRNSPAQAPGRGARSACANIKKQKR